jgi:hypothetical protein
MQDGESDRRADASYAGQTAWEVGVRLIQRRGFMKNSVIGIILE